MSLYRVICVAALLITGTDLVHALDVENYRATVVEVEGGTATLFSHESVLFGLSCRSGPVGKFTNLKQVKLGDYIKLNDYSFRVGLIEVSRFLEDSSWGKTIIAKKGDIVCVVAADEKSLPTAYGCDALWIRIPKCRPIQ